jgi:hypothetical protein
MNKFTPRKKLSKKNRKSLDQKARSSWGAVNPVTRVKHTGKAYKRAKRHEYKNTDNFM